jgi:hypothetical protein
MSSRILKNSYRKKKKYTNVKHEVETPIFPFVATRNSARNDLFEFISDGILKLSIITAELMRIHKKNRRMSHPLVSA